MLVIGGSSVSVLVSVMLDSSVLNSSSIKPSNSQEVVLLLGRVSIRLIHRARLRFVKGEFVRSTFKRFATIGVEARDRSVSLLLRLQTIKVDCQQT